MAEAQRSTVTPAPAAAGAKPSLLKKPGAAAPRDVLKVVLPTVPKEASHDLNDYHAVIMGEPGTGKTTLGTEEPGVFLLSFDPLRKNLRILQEYVPDWRHFEAYLTALEEANKGGKFPYKRVIVDGADLWYRSCQAFVCKKLGIDHPSEEGWARGWDLLSETFTRGVNRIKALPCGFWTICHAREKDIEKRAGKNLTRFDAVLGGRANEILIGMADLVLALRYDGDDRIGIIRGDEWVTAKCTVDGHFLTPKGRQVKEIFLGSEGPAKAYERFLHAFENKQTYVTIEEYKKSKGGPAPAKAKPLVSAASAAKKKAPEIPF
jgi:hypothetical protein